MEDPTPPSARQPGRRADIRRLRNRASLIKPQTLEDILVEDERPYYDSRQHWASVIQPIYETFIFLLLIIWAVDIGRGTGWGNSLVTTILILAAAHFVITTITGGRLPNSRLAADPFANTTGKSALGRTPLIVIAISVVAAAVLIGLRPTLMIAVILVIGRLVVILARWSFYEKRYITNRRVIESGGFLGSRISSMPLSRVTDISYSRSIAAELLGYATMRVETAGQDQALGVVRFIDQPNDFYDVLVRFSAPTAVQAEEEKLRAERKRSGN